VACETFETTYVVSRLNVHFKHRTHCEVRFKVVFGCSVLVLYNSLQLLPSVTQCEAALLNTVEWRSVLMCTVSSLVHGSRTRFMFLILTVRCCSKCNLILTKHWLLFLESRRSIFYVPGNTGTDVFTSLRSTVASTRRSSWTTGLLLHCLLYRFVFNDVLLGTVMEKV